MGSRLGGVTVRGWSGGGGGGVGELAGGGVGGVVWAGGWGGARGAAETAAVGTVGLYLDFEGSDDAHAWWRHHRA